MIFFLHLDLGLIFNIIKKRMKHFLIILTEILFFVFGEQILKNLNMILRKHL